MQLRKDNKEFNVVHIVPSLQLSFGGPSYTVPSLCSALHEIDVQVSLFSIKDCLRPNREVDRFNYCFINIPGIVTHRFRLSWSPLFEKSLLTFCRKNRVDIIHNHGLWMPVNHAAAKVAKKSNIPLISAPRGMMNQWAMGNASYKKRLALSLYQKKDLEAVTVFHATAPSEFDDIRNLGYTQPIAVIPNGVDIPEMRPRKNRTAGQDRVALFLSRIHPKKGLPLLIEAWAKVSPSGWKCQIVGPDEDHHQKQLEKQLAKHGISDQFVFRGMVTAKERLELLREADIFVLPSYSENFGVVVAEALAAGVPVLTTKGTPWQELVEHKCGWWVNQDLDGVTDGLRAALYTDDETLEQMGSRGRLLITEKYGWNKIAGETRDVYEWITRGGELPRNMRLACDHKMTTSSF